MFYKRIILFVTVLIILECLIGFMIGEITLRIFSPAWLIQRMRELNVSKQVIPFGSDKGMPIEKIDGKIVCFTPFSKFEIRGYEYSNTINIDKWGGRFTINTETIRGQTVVPFLGDSVTFGMGVQDNETFVSLLSTNLKINLLNLGIPGSGLSEQIDIIKKRHKELGYPPLYVFNFFMGNDFVNILNYRRVNLEAKRSKGRLKQNNIRLYNFLEKINRYIYYHPFLKKSYFIQFVKVKLLNIYNKSQYSKKRQDIFLIVDKNNKDFIDEAKRGLEMELQRLIALSNQLHFKIIFIIIPDRLQVYADLLRLKSKYYALNEQDIDSDLPNKILIKQLYEKNIPYIDILGCLQNKGADLYYIQDNHLTVAGHKAVAECILMDLKYFILNKDVLSVERFL